VSGPLGHEARQQRKRLTVVLGLHPPPEAVAASQAAGRDASVPQRAVEALPGSEGGRTLARLVLVVQEEERHATILSPRGRLNIGRRP